MPFLTVLLALAASTCWGGGDFSGGMASRRSDAFRSVLLAYSVGLVLIGVLAILREETIPPFMDLVWGAISGLCGMAGLGFLYRGLSTGRMGVVAPVSAVLASAIPVIFTGITTGLPAVLQLAGFLLALVGIWLLSQPAILGDRPKGLGMAALAGLGFAGFFIALDQVGPTAVYWPLIAGRLVACTAMAVFAIITHRPVLNSDTPLKLLLVAGVLDVLGNIFFLMAVQVGRLDVATVLGSLYPAVTTLLAWGVAKEHLTPRQITGVGAAVVAIILIVL